MNFDYQKTIEKAEEYKPAICKFLRELIAIPSKSGNEKNVVLRIKEEMQRIGFDRIEIDAIISNRNLLLLLNLLHLIYTEAKEAEQKLKYPLME